MPAILLGASLSLHALVWLMARPCAPRSLRADPISARPMRDPRDQGATAPVGVRGAVENYQFLAVPDRNQETPTRSPCGRCGGPPVPCPAGGFGGGVVLPRSYLLAAAGK